MYHETIKTTGLRELTSAELELVAGGLGADSDPGGGGDWGDDIVVTGTRDSGGGYDPWQDVWDAFFGDYWDQSSGGDGGGGGGDPSPAPSGNGITDDQRDKAIDAIEAARALLQQAIERYGTGTMADLNGKILPAYELLEDLGHLSDVLQAGNLIYGLETGDKGLADAIGWLAGIAAVGVAGELGVGVGLAALLGIAADKIVTAGIEQGQVVYNGAVEVFHQQVDQFVQNNPGPQFDPFDPGAWFDGLMGIPHNPNPNPNENIP